MPKEVKMFIIEVGYRHYGLTRDSALRYMTLMDDAVELARHGYDGPWHLAPETDRGERCIRTATVVMEPLPPKEEAKNVEEALRG